MDALLADVDTLTGILLYHVVGSVILADAVIEATEVETANGQSVGIEVTEAGVVLDGVATVTATDILCTNGVVHIIDTVLRPAPVNTCCPEESTNAEGNPGCAADPACEAVVCAEDSFCCDRSWDGICAGLAEDICEPIEECAATE